MTLASETSRITYTGDGTTTVFPIPFYFQANADIVVLREDLVGVRTTQTLGSNYTLTGATLAAGGSCTMVIAPPTGYILAIYRDPPATQTTSYNDNDPFPAKSHELALDKMTTLIQRLKDRLARAVVVPETVNTTDEIQTTLPVAGEWLRWNATKDGIESSAVVTSSGAYPVATQSEAEAGTLNTVLMTPLRTAQAITYATAAVPTNIYELGAVVDASNATPGWNAMIASWKANGYNNWYMPGAFIFNSRPDDINSRVTRDVQESYTFNLKGQGAYRTNLYKNFVSSGTADGICNIRQNDVHISDMQFTSLVGSQTGGGLGSGCMISAVAPSFAIGYCSLRDIDITSGGGAGNAYHWTGLYFDGRKGNTSAAAGLGVRGYELNNIKIFGGETAAAIFDNVVALTWMGGSTFNAGGNTGKLIFAGEDKDTPSAWSALTTYLLGDYVASGGLYYRSKTTNTNKLPVSFPADWEAQVLATTGTVSATVVLSTLSDGISITKGTGVSVTASEYDGGTISFTSNATGCRTRGYLANGATVSNSGVVCFHAGDNFLETSATNGWRKLESSSQNLIEQWFQVAVTNVATAYSYPIAFPTKTLMVQVTPKGVAGADQIAISAGGVTASQVALIGTGNLTAFVRVIGY